LGQTNEKNDSNKNTEKLEKFVIALATFVGITSIIAWTGLRKIKLRSESFIVLFPATLIFLFVITYTDYAYLNSLHKLLPTYFTRHVILFLRTIPKIKHFVFLVFATSYTVGMILGFGPYFRKKKLQKDLDAIGFVNGNGDKPKIIREIEIDNNKSKVHIVAKAIGVDRFKEKKNDLESCFERIIESINLLGDRRTIEIFLCKNELIRMFPFNEAETQLKNPYNFIVGESGNGVIVANIRELPHLLIAGTTGGGKSVYFRQLFVSLLKYSSHLQVYLIDLKHGIEVKEFGQLPNVKIAKNETEAIKLLSALRDEMRARFVFMEKNNIKNLEPEVHKRDLIVVGIDEASVLYGKTSIKANKQLVAQARELTDEISKLARAAGIHLVIATQKPLNESLDSKTLGNLAGRMIFKMSTHGGSNSALGNSKAYSLPDIKGRGIWGAGNKYIEVQTPYLSELELDEECKEIADRMIDQGFKNFQPMLEINSPKITPNQVIGHTMNEEKKY
jgi:hypothetical protein